MVFGKKSHKIYVGLLKELRELWRVNEAFKWG
jgi:hypothetical protein